MSFLKGLFKKKNQGEKGETKSEKDILTDLINVSDRWTRAETLETLRKTPSQETLSVIEQAINELRGESASPYRKNVDPISAYEACQGIIYYAKVGVFKSDPYAVQALIPLVGNQEDFISRQLRSQANGDWLFAMYQLLKAQREISDML